MATSDADEPALSVQHHESVMSAIRYHHPVFAIDNETSYLEFWWGIPWRDYPKVVASKVEHVELGGVLLGHYDFILGRGADIDGRLPELAGSRALGAAVANE